MAIKFFNIRSGETRIAKSDPVIADAHIAALWGSSDRSPNVNQGQDFGWRLAPETVVEIERIQQDPRLLESIAVQLGILPDSIKESDILLWISSRNDKKVQGLEKTTEDFNKQYEDDIRRLRESGQMDSHEAILPTVPAVQRPQPLPTDTETVPEQIESEGNPGTSADTPTTPDEPTTVSAENTPGEQPGEESTVGNDDGGSEEEKAEEAASVTNNNGELTVPEGDGQTSTEAPSEPQQAQEVDESMSRAQLEAIAKDAGVDAPSGFANKGELVKAIQQQRSAQ